ncbi:MAG: DUF167 domain-containing protein [Candidatus Ancillula sp.]|jgi:uncharacterized protein YggU (UPF0235/DUF167 family)|nr:DUF167 domain-containing protein [Candidatus Ancillula sp.]
MRVSVFVKPGSKKGPLIEKLEYQDPGNAEFVVFLRNRAIDGAANKELIEQLAKHFDVSKSSVSILQGHAGRRKLVEIDI